jgi:dethiobiotin synthetase/adenosylmethionine--8-amino-7-oxononanoate aminotransferase
VLVLPPLPQDPNENLAEWFAIAEETFAQLRSVLESSHLKRLRRLEEMPKKASQILWWPFTQHDLVPEESITLIDSRLGDNFSVYKVNLIRTKVSSSQFYEFLLGFYKMHVRNHRDAYFISNA